MVSAIIHPTPKDCTLARLYFFSRQALASTKREISEYEPERARQTCTHSVQHLLLSLLSSACLGNTSFFNLNFKTPIKLST
jgi:hypothetical protein